MTSDRRDDVGTKVILGLLSSIVMLFVGLFIHATWATANEGNINSNISLQRVAVLEAQFKSIQMDLTEIKDLLKRDIPARFKND